MKTLLLIIAFAGFIFSQTNYEKVNLEISKGNFTIAAKMIDSLIFHNVSLTEVEKYDLEFQKDRLNRIRLDFNKNYNDVLTYVKKYYPDADEKLLQKWEESKVLEMMVIDGEKKYFARAASNIFLIDKEAKAQKQNIDGKKEDELDKFCEGIIPGIISNSVNAKTRNVNPLKLKLKYSLTVDPNFVPDGEVIRCWLPFPREIKNRQENIKLNSISEQEYIIADNKNLQRTIYVEKKAVKDKPTVFKMELEYTSFADYTNVEADKVKGYDVNSDLYKVFTTERPLHIVFTDRVKEVSEKIIGDETNPYLKAKKIFTWISQTKPWAGAREYSTIENISDYILREGHGDCGIKTLLFVTLCRYNGIPAKWQSGWMLHPVEVNLHDWGEVYFEGYGWVPVDQSFGIQNLSDEKEKYFYLGGLDQYRLIANDDYSQPLFPAKIYPRSETVDFQRGEVEWRGGNLYFDKWDYHMDVEYEEVSTK
ncbi:MAG: transglutaminase domain-containing protein [Ignavibacteriales bacterium]|nr:MAG: transglutaminase domain-containing protein [Ignavibacteriales bacterium]